MKASAVLSIFVLTSCVLLNGKTSKVHLLIEYSFDDTRVEIYLDGDKIYDQIANTDASISLADEHVINTSLGEHTLKVRIGIGQEKTINFDAEENSETYLGIRLKNANLIIHRYSVALIYD